MLNRALKQLHCAYPKAQGSLLYGAVFHTAATALLLALTQNFGKRQNMSSAFQHDAYYTKRRVRVQYCNEIVRGFNVQD